MNTIDVNLPTEHEAEAAKIAIEALRGLNATSQAAFVRVLPADRGNQIEVTLPPDAVRALLRVLTHMANGDAVAVMPVHVELTTQEVADFLNVSRPHVVKLVEEGNIPCRKVGTHRRILLADAVEYRKKDHARRKAILDDLTREAQELGLDY